MRYRTRNLQCYLVKKCCSLTSVVSNWHVCQLIELIGNFLSLSRGKVNRAGVHVYIYMCVCVCVCLWTQKIFESYFSDRLTFSNIRSRTSGRIYRLALLLRAPERLSSLSNSRI